MDLFNPDYTEIGFENADPELDTLYMLNVENKSVEDSVRLLTDYLVTSVNMLPEPNTQIMKDHLRNVKTSLHGAIQAMNRGAHIVPSEQEFLISFDTTHELYKSIPRYIANKFQNINSIQMHYHFCSQIYDNQFMYRDHPTKLFDLDFDDIVEFPNGDRWYCIDEGTRLFIGSFNSLIAVLEANKKFTQCLKFLREFLGDAFIIVIDEIIVSKINGENIGYISIEDFINDYLSMPNYRYRYDWYWRLPNDGQ